MNPILDPHSDEVQAILEKYPAEHKRPAVMALLYLAQMRQGYITKQALEEIAAICAISTTDVASMVGFYTLFHDQPEGRYRFQVCTDLSCAMAGAEEFLEKLCTNIGIKVGETTADGLITIEEVKCLAGCHHAPVMQVQGKDGIIYHEDMTVEKVLDLVKELRSKEGLP